MRNVFLSFTNCSKNKNILICYFCLCNRSYAVPLFGGLRFQSVRRAHSITRTKYFPHMRRFRRHCSSEFENKCEAEPSRFHLRCSHISRPIFITRQLLRTRVGMSDDARFPEATGARSNRTRAKDRAVIFLSEKKIYSRYSFNEKFNECWKRSNNFMIRLSSAQNSKTHDVKTLISSRQ